jgi:Fe-S-cluster containining protein
VEFEIDVEAVKQITSEEYDLAAAEVEARGAIAAYRHSLVRHDARLAAAPDASSLACKAGCSWCCNFSVDVRPVEVFNILEFVATNLDSGEQARIRGEIAANDSRLKGLSEAERVKRNIKCPFLSSAGRCVIYPARPQTCRNYHATDATGCQRSFEEPENLDIDPDFAPMVYQIGGAHVEAVSQALDEAGYDTRAYELNSALAVALTDPEALHRFLAKQEPFPDLLGIDVEPEFGELPP